MIGRLVLAVLVMGVLGGCGEDSGDVSGAAEVPSASAVSSSPAAAPSPSVTPPSVAPTPENGARQVTVYYVGDGPRGPVLFREVRPVYEPDHGPAEPIGLLSAEPRDPDYRTAWPPGAFAGGGVNWDVGTIDVHLADSSLHDRPTALNEAEAQASIQQVVYTLQAYAGEALPVRFLLGDQAVDRLLGVPTADPVAAAPLLSTLSLMSLTTPAEGQVVSGSFRASGFNNGYEGTAAWQIWRGDELIQEGATIAADAYGEELYEWRVRVHVSDLAPGSYTFLSSNDDPTSDGVGPDQDTRAIVVQ